MDNRSQSSVKSQLLNRFSNKPSSTTPSDSKEGSKNDKVKNNLFTLSDDEDEADDKFDKLVCSSHLLFLS